MKLVLNNTANIYSISESSKMGEILVGLMKIIYQVNL